MLSYGIAYQRILPWIFNKCEVLIENSATRVTVRHHEACRVMPTVTRVTEFSISTSKPLLFLFLAISSFDNCIIRWPDIDIETFGGNWRENQKWRQNVQIVILKSCTKVVFHPLCETTFPSPGRVRGNPGWVCKNSTSFNRVKRELKRHSLLSI